MDRNYFGQFRRGQSAPAARHDVTPGSIAAQNARVDTFLATYEAARSDFAARRITGEEFGRRVEAARRAQSEAA